MNVPKRSTRTPRPRPTTRKPTLSNDALTLLYEMICSVQLPVGHPEFADRAATVAKAKAELERALAAGDGPGLTPTTT